MKEHGIKLDDELTIEGSLGEELDKGYLETLKEWIEWEKSCVEVPDGVMDDVVVQRYYPISEEHSDSSTEDDYDVVSVRSSSIEEDDKSYDDGGEDCRIRRLPPPRRVLWRHEMEVLNTALVLPYGWEVHVAVDNRSPVSVRKEHLAASLAYLRKNAISVIHQDIYNKSSYHFAHRITGGSTMYEQGGDMRSVYVGADIDAHVRNLLLIEWQDTMMERRLLHTIDNSVIFGGLDWETVPHSGDPTSDFGRMVTYMTGGEYIRNHLELEIDRTMSGLHFSGSLVSVEQSCERLSRLYSKLLDRTPNDITKMGLRPILGLNENRLPWSPVPLNEMVEWVNYCTITYTDWRMDVEWALEHRKQHKFEIISEDSFSDIVRFLSCTLGMRVMRKMSATLLAYIKENEESVKTKKAVSKAALDRRDKLTKAIHRCKALSNLIEDYLRSHEGQDEGIKTFSFDSVVGYVYREDRSLNNDKDGIYF
jgi:hypothetical protein